LIQWEAFFLNKISLGKKLMSKEEAIQALLKHRTDWKNNPAATKEAVSILMKAGADWWLATSLAFDALLGAMLEQ
jgi:hypothetical protein